MDFNNSSDYLSSLRPIQNRFQNGTKSILQCINFIFYLENTRQNPLYANHIVTESTVHRIA